MREARDGPVTIGGKIRWSARGGTKDMLISRREQMRDVPGVNPLDSSRAQGGINYAPNTFPYASGHGPRVIVPSAAVVEGQVPSLYMALKIFKPFGQLEKTSF